MPTKFNWTVNLALKLKTLPLFLDARRRKKTAFDKPNVFAIKALRAYTPEEEEGGGKKGAGRGGKTAPTNVFKSRKYLLKMSAEKCSWQIKTGFGFDDSDSPTAPPVEATEGRRD